ncbi:MAG: hypothetical protein KTR18_00225 [Acidiferrobacterales bacterium]|nr:hypothetical protein [Acidiferrobacterales bacterium]
MIDQLFVAFGGQVCQFDYEGAELESLLTFLFSKMVVPDVGDNQLCARYRIRSEENSWCLFGEGMSKQTFDHINTLGSFLSGDVLFRLIEQNEGHLAIHAGLVSRRGKSLLIPAESGSGKTSVTAWLTSMGWCYHTDELVLIDLQHGDHHAFSRPLNVKAKGLIAIQELVDNQIVSADSRRVARQAAGISMILPSIFSRNKPVEEQQSIPPIGTIIFPKYSTAEPPHLSRLSAAAAGLELMRSNVIARNLPGHGFRDVANLVKKTPAYSLRYSHFKDLAPLFSEIFCEW